MQEFDQFISECDRGPRLNQLAKFFSETAAGDSGIPRRKPVVDTRLLPNDVLMRQFIELHARRQGNFDQHYHSSIPYRLEEECRMAYTILRYSRSSLESLSLYSLGTAEGTMARTLSELSGGKIQSLSCSPNEENHKCFMAFGDPPHASFFLGPFHRLSKEYLRADAKLARFSGGFDFIFEDTTFQMYSANREMQIEFIAQHLKPDGIMLFLEKFRSADENDYVAREAQKDFGFKTHYFGTDEIVRKKDAVLNTMHDCEVTLQAMAAAIYNQFRHCVVTWNSGNFYELAASNSTENLQKYVSLLPEPAIPVEYVYETSTYLELASVLTQLRNPTS
ncbi:class I SAM-dependent methyltransferase [Agrobacterium sp. T29]|uniref:class I SAM-dependent methyltransferase n=1 Tax=Agrobacterium sp. T29 TaxID=2580515 RepID=UPI00115F4D98|nr:class I SAM-dependent methyltransferase [Agrobacterium sp. T29]